MFCAFNHVRFNEWGSCWCLGSWGFPSRAQYHLEGRDFEAPTHLLFDINLKQPLFLKCGDSARLDGDGACVNALKLTPTPTGFGSRILTSTVHTDMMQLAYLVSGTPRVTFASIQSSLAGRFPMGGATQHTSFQ